MVNSVLRIPLLLSLLILGACASKMGKQMDSYRTSYAAGDFEKAKTILEKSDLKKEKNSHLLWSLEKGTTALALNDLDTAISSFNSALDEIDKLYTKRISTKAATFLINDASDVFYGANYERSYAHYFLAKSYYTRYLKAGVRLDLQSARATILSWDTYFTEVQRAGKKTLYHTDLMMKVFGGQIHEVSDIRSDKQISLQLYKDALIILDREGGLFSLFNKKNIEYVKAFEEAMETQKDPKASSYEPTAAYDDLKQFLQYKVLALTNEIRASDFSREAKAMKATPEIIKKAQAAKANVVIVMEEGLIPPKIGKPFNFGLKGAVDSVNNPTTKAAIAAVGTVFLTQFAMEKLNMWPTQTASPGSFIFAYEVTKLAVQEAAVEFELPMIENVPLVQRLELFVLDEAGKVITHGPLPIISENGDIARVVLEEDVVSRYVKTGTRVAVKHIVAIVAAIAVYKQVEPKGGDFFAKAAAMATYIGASKGIKAMERADTRHWTTLPQALRMSELTLRPGNYQLAVSVYAGEAVPKEPMKVVGNIIVSDSGKSIHTIKFSLNP